MERPLGVVLVRDGNTECCHHGVADELLDGAARSFDLGRHGVVEAVEQRRAFAPGPPSPPTSSSLRGPRRAHVASLRSSPSLLAVCRSAAKGTEASFGGSVASQPAQRFMLHSAPRSFRAASDVRTRRRIGRVLAPTGASRTAPIGARSLTSGPGRDRTCDLGIKSPLLYQLSYRPSFRSAAEYASSMGKGYAEGSAVEERLAALERGDDPDARLDAGRARRLRLDRGRPETHFIGWLDDVDPDALFASGEAWGIQLVRLKPSAPSARAPSGRAAVDVAALRVVERHARDDRRTSPGSSFAIAASRRSRSASARAAVGGASAAARRSSALLTGASPDLRRWSVTKPSRS